MAEEGHKVTLNVYDLSQGLARQLSVAFLGKPIEAIWHTGILVYGNEYYFGGGIQHDLAGRTPYGAPIRVVDLGVTHVPKDIFELYLQEISPRYTAETYSLLTHNCNNFSNEVAQFLVGATIPDYILQLPHEVMSSPMGPLLMPMIQNLETTLKSGTVPQVPQFRPSMAQATQPVTTFNVKKSSSSNPKFPTEKPMVKDAVNGVKAEVPSTKPEELKTSERPVSPAVKPAEAQQKKFPEDPLGDARSKVQKEISTEFAAIMATGTLRASEAAALATKRVMQRYAEMNVMPHT